VKVWIALMMLTMELYISQAQQMLDISFMANKRMVLRPLFWANKAVMDNNNV